MSGTRLYSPEDFALVKEKVVSSFSANTVLEVTDETTGGAARRLALREGVDHVVALNFASGKNPGGGFISGARAQEEDLARCSALYPCLLKEMDYYKPNQRSGSMLYTDHAIYSPDVPFFRDDHLVLLEQPFVVSIITSPAPNAREVLRRDSSAGAKLTETLQRSACAVLKIASWQGHKVLVLGAWGCGVFRNDPAMVAEAFFSHLLSGAFKNVFERVVFAVYDNSAYRKNYQAFMSLLSPEKRTP